MAFRIVDKIKARIKKIKGIFKRKGRKTQKARKINTVGTPGVIVSRFDDDPVEHEHPATASGGTAPATVAPGVSEADKADTKTDDPAATEADEAKPTSNA